MFSRNSLCGATSKNILRGNTEQFLTSSSNREWMWWINIGDGREGAEVGLLGWKAKKADDDKVKSSEKKASNNLPPGPHHRLDCNSHAAALLCPLSGVTGWSSAFISVLSGCGPGVSGCTSEVEFRLVLASGPVGFGNQNLASRGRSAVQLGLCGAELTPPPGPASGGLWAAELRWRSSSGVPAGWRPGSARLYRKRADGSTPQREAEWVPYADRIPKWLWEEETQGHVASLFCDLQRTNLAFLVKVVFFLAIINKSTIYKFPEHPPEWLWRFSCKVQY